MSNSVDPRTLVSGGLFHRVPERTRQVLLTRARPRQLAAGAHLLSLGQMNGSLFILVDGALDVRLGGDDRAHLRLAPGECVGELSLVDGQPASADVVAATRATVLEVPHADVWAVIDSSAQFARNLLRILAGRVRNDDAALSASIDRRRHYERLSMVDGLTALNNRRWLDAVFPPHLDRLLREERSAALLMADVDHFKRFNDEHGHAVGDAVLRAVAIALTNALRPDDLLARYGGEEFAALMGDVDEAAAVEVAERLCNAVAALRLQGGLGCTISIGVALARPDEAFPALACRADEALFRAKGDGRNCVRL